MSGGKFAYYEAPKCTVFFITHSTVDRKYRSKW